MKTLLQSGEISILGRHPAASNTVFLVDVTLQDVTARAIYKPVAGERPLWDFPQGNLARREVAASAFITALGFAFVPPTVWRDEAPYGAGSLQLWVDDATIEDVEIMDVLSDGWLRVLDAELQDGTPVIVAHRNADELRAIALLDAVMNNGDRKAGHLLRDPRGALWAVDHGVTFHTDPKLRTVLWGFLDEPISSDLQEVLRAVPNALHAVGPWLSPAEIDGIQQRTHELLTTGVFPRPSGEWPAIPWPIY